MTIKGFDALEKSEQEDFASACAKRKLSQADFLVALDDAYPISGIGHIRRVVNVARHGRGEGRPYPAGSGTSWLMAFEQDLLNGVFD
jgi:hypothetical protein